MKTTSNPPAYCQERWFSLLQGAVERLGVVRVAQLLGYNNHSGTSQVLAGRYAGAVDRFAARVLKTFDLIRCPHQSAEIQANVCRELATAPAPLNNPMKMLQWRACQGCRNKQQEV